MKTEQRLLRVFLIVGSATGWFAIVTQFYLIISNSSLPAFSVVVNFFSYFTILTNIIVALCFTVILTGQESSLGKFFLQPKILTAIAVYISIVGIVYNVVLRFIWDPQGLQRVVDELLHSVIPILFVLFWLMFVPKKVLGWRDAFSWLIYPIIYSLYIVVRGIYSGLYPYPFIDVNELGYSTVLLNTSIILLAFLFVSFLFISVGKALNRRMKLD